MVEKEYKVQIYTKYGYFEYIVKELSQAMEHAQLIMERGVYRRVNERGQLEFWQVIKVKIDGPDLGSAYSDVFKRT